MSAPGFQNYPANYLLFNQQLSKNLAIVMKIEGVPDLYGISDTFTTVRYGDPGIVFGTPGLVYGALRRISGVGGTASVKPYIVLDQAMSITQRIEPEQGKGNVGTLTMTLIDYNGEISRIISPGIVVDEILAGKEVKIYLGFAQTSFPEDYLLLYRGYITSLSCPPSIVKFQLSDSTSKKRQPLFNTPTTILTGSINNSQTTIPVGSTSGFHTPIVGPDGTYDTHVSCFIKIDSEIMEYDQTGIAPTQFTVSRGGSSSLGTTPAAHDAGASVSNSVQFGKNVGGINFIDLILKLLLSGWNGPCETNITLLSFVYTYDATLGFQNNAFVLKNDDANLDLGLTAGDYFTISGATNSGNNISGKITSFANLNGTGTYIVFTDQTFILENPTSAVSSFRSKYDTFPVTCGASCRMRDVDVTTFEYIRNTYFTSAGASNMRIYYDAPIAAKDAIDTDITLPMGCYGISRFGRISLSICKPPLPGVGKLLTLDWTNVLDPDKITVVRATNNRNFWNLISFTFDFNVASGNFNSVNYFLDTQSLSLFNQTSQLPISAPGLASDLGGATIAQNRGNALLNRYKSGAIMIDVTVNWSVGSLIEVTDIVVLNDNGNLKIMNFETGERNLGTQLFEVIERSYNVTDGNVKLKLLGGLGFNVNSRFGLYAPSTLLNMGCTTTLLRLTPSFGQTNINDELNKWTPYIGQSIQVHDLNWTVVGTSTITGVNATDPSALTIDPPLGFTPASGYILDIPPYPTSTNTKEQAQYKALYAHLTPSIPVTSGVSGTQFNVSLSDAANLTVGNTVILRNASFSTVSAEIKIDSIVGTLVTLDKSLGFTPNNTYTVEGIGFKDGGSFYRFD